MVAALAPLQPWRARGGEVLVVDGGSRDATVQLAAPWVDAVLTSRRGRAVQMNAGAAQARGDVLLFLHADTRLPPAADLRILQCMGCSANGWGRFDPVLEGVNPLLRLVGPVVAIRSRWNGIATGEQGIFVRRDWFEAVGGYPEIPLLEDVALSRALLRRGRPLCLHGPAVTSGRRWDHNGFWRTLWLMMRLRRAYARGVSPTELVKRYYPDWS